jgi:hypothetical protein
VKGKQDGNKPAKAAVPATLDDEVVADGGRGRQRGKASSGKAAVKGACGKVKGGGRLRLRQTCGQGSSAPEPEEVDEELMDSTEEDDD